jgi:exoribonuclease R
LEALALCTDQSKVPNRCVTLWAYIDERDGKLLEAGLERTIISSPQSLSFRDATKLLDCSIEDTPKEMSSVKAVLAGAERNLSLWSARHMQMNKAAQQREVRLKAREMVAANTNRSYRDDGAGGSFQRSRGHRLVDSALDLYAFALGTLMKRAKQPIPRAAGRLGTAPLRRYIDGLAQRQALSALCNYGIPLTFDECRAVSKKATDASNELTNLRSSNTPKTRQ